MPRLALCRAVVLNSCTDRCRAKRSQHHNPTQERSFVCHVANSHFEPKVIDAALACNVRYTAACFKRILIAKLGSSLFPLLDLHVYRLT